MRNGKRFYISLGACGTLFALAMFAGRIPFAENPGAEYGAPPVPLFSAEYFRNFLPLAVILALSAVGILLLSAIRRVVRGKKTASHNGHSGYVRLQKENRGIFGASL